MRKGNKDISELNLSVTIVEKLREENINTVNDLWNVERYTLKDFGFSNNEIKTITIKMQLLGIDLNNKIY